MLGTIVNTATIAIGSLIGVMLRRRIPERVTDAIMKGIALCVIYIGISGTMEGRKTLAMIVSMALGGLLGTVLDLDGGMNALGRMVERRISPGGKGGIAEGFVTASLIYCVGAMAVVGSLQSGLTGNHEMLYTKSMLDGISSMVLSASLGIGVALSALSVLVYQGAITLLAQVVAPVLTEAIVAEMTCVGSLMIMGLGLNMLGVTKLKVMDYVPAIAIVIPLCYVM